MKSLFWPALHQFLVFFALGELFDQLLDFLGLAFVSEQDGIVRLHQNHIASPDDRDGSALAGAGVENDVSRGIHMEELAHRAIAFRIRFEVPRQGGP
jgi:hypothetical protein